MTGTDTILTYFHDSALPMAMWLEGRDWLLEARWEFNGRTAGVRWKFDERPDGQVLNMMHVNCVEECKRWFGHLMSGDLPLEVN